MATTQQDANQYIFQDGQWIKVGKTKLVTVQEAGPVPTVAASKQIYLTTYALPMSGPGDTVRLRICRVNLVNFDASDVGSKIWLYRKRRGNTQNLKKDWNHPLDYTIASQVGKNIAGLGYGVKAGKCAGMDDTGMNVTWLPLNSYQIANGHNGFAQTEWILTTEDINNGYKDINISELLIDLLCYSPKNNYNSWDEIVSGTFKIAGTGVFKFNVVDYLGTQLTYASDAIYIDLAGGRFNADAFKNISNDKYQNKYMVRSSIFGFKVLR